MPYIDPYFDSIYWKHSYPRSNGQTTAQITPYGYGVYFYDYNSVKRNYKNAVIHNQNQTIMNEHKQIRNYRKNNKKYIKRHKLNIYRKQHIPTYYSGYSF